MVNDGKSKTHRMSVILPCHVPILLIKLTLPGEGVDDLLLDSLLSL